MLDTSSDMDARRLIGVMVGILIIFVVVGVLTSG